MAIQFTPGTLPIKHSIIVLDRKKGTGSNEREELQRFTFMGSVPHVTRDGEHSAVMRWLTNCSSCNRLFEFKTGLTTRSYVRRCRPCRRDTPRETSGWPQGPRIRHTLLPPKPKRPPLARIDDEIDPASLF